MITVGPHRIADDRGIFFVLGPCVIESENLALDAAREIAGVANSLDVKVIFKSSYDKANRTAVDSFRGPGVDEGLRILRRVREETGLPVLSDVHTAEQARVAGAVLDVIQIPALLCRQTDLLLAAGKTGKPVNIKKGQFVAPEDMVYAANKVRSTGNDAVLITERGSSFGYHDLVVDMRSLVRLSKEGLPVIFDATHSAQLPSAGCGASSGDRSMIAPLARAAVAAGVDGVFMEVHPEPRHALCDGANSLALADLRVLLESLVAVDQVVRRARLDQPRPVDSPGNDELQERDSWMERLARVRLIIFDVDGILTDGKITYGNPDVEIKSFHVRDGHGIKIAKRCGLDVALITGRSSDVVERRARELEIDHVYQGRWFKKEALAELVEATGLEPYQMAVLGDDVVDIPLMRRVGIAMTVREAPEEVRREAGYVTSLAGGEGAAREVLEMILRAQGQWDQAMARYYE